MRQFLALFAFFVIVGTGCSKDQSEIPESAVGGTWASDCTLLSQSSGSGPLSQKISLPNFAQMSPSTAAITNFADTTCASPYSSIIYHFESSLESERTGSNSFDIRLRLTSVDFTAHSTAALDRFKELAKKKDAAFDGRSLSVGTSFDATNKIEQYENGSVRCSQLFQFYSDPNRPDEKRSNINCVRPMNDTYSLVLIPGTNFRKE